MSRAALLVPVLCLCAGCGGSKSSSPATQTQATTYTGTADTAYASQSAGERHEHSAKLADEVLKAVHSY